MKGPKMKLFWAAAAVGSLVTLTLGASPGGAAAGKKASRKLKCYAKAAAKDLPVDTACLGKATTKFTADFNKLTGCTGDGNVAGIETLIDNECVNQLVTVDGMGHVTAICPAVG